MEACIESSKWRGKVKKKGKKSSASSYWNKAIWINWSYDSTRVIWLLSGGFSCVPGANWYQTVQPMPKKDFDSMIFLSRIEYTFCRWSWMKGRQGVVSYSWEGLLLFRTRNWVMQNLSMNAIFLGKVAQPITILYRISLNVSLPAKQIVQNWISAWMLCSFFPFSFFQPDW